MYAEHFDLRALPFENVPDPAFFFYGGDYNRVLQRMTDALTAGRGLLAIAGPIGSGKTTLSQKLMADLPETTRLIWLAEPPAKADDLFLFVAQDLGIQDMSSTRIFVLRDIRESLLKIRREEKHCLIIVDESHLMSDEVLEGVRLLNNLEQGAAKLVQIILLGQQELITQLSRPELEPFRQRISGLEVIGKMDSERLRKYILHRLEVAGSRREIFSENALKAITLSSGGVPRVTNSLSDRSLRIAYEENKSVVGAREVHKAAMDLGMGRKTMHFLLRLRSEQQVQEVPSDQSNGSKEPPSIDTPAPPEKQQPDSATATREAGGREGSYGLVTPLLCLMISIAALAASLLFYCSRDGTSFSRDCLKGLLGNLFP